MLIYDWYFKQAVTEEQMNDAFGAVQSSMFNLMTDQSLVGIAQGGVAGPTTPTANLSIVIGGPTYAYDQLGERIYAATFSADCSKDLNNVSTAVAGVGNEKYLAVFILFERDLSDPVIDGNGFTVYYVQAESYEYQVYQGAEAPVGTATQPALINPGLLVADVHLVYGQTQIMSGDINSGSPHPVRVQFTFVIDQSPYSVVAGTVPEAIAAMLTDLNQHVNIGGHPATVITSTAVSGTPLALGSSNVQADLAAIVPPVNVLLNSYSLREIVSLLPSPYGSGYTYNILKNSPYAGGYTTIPLWIITFTNCRPGDVLEIYTNTFYSWDPYTNMSNVGFGFNFYYPDAGTYNADPNNGWNLDYNPFGFQEGQADWATIRTLDSTDTSATFRVYVEAFIGAAPSGANSLAGNVDIMIGKHWRKSSLT